LSLLCCVHAPTSSVGALLFVMICEANDDTATCEACWEFVMICEANDDAATCEACWEFVMICEANDDAATCEASRWKNFP